MMCGFLGLISNDEINIDKLEESNKFNICRGPDSKAIISPPLLFQVANDSWTNSLVVFMAEIHEGHPIFFVAIFTTKPATYEMSASLYSDI